MTEAVLPVDPAVRLARNAAALWTSSAVTSGLLLGWQLLLARTLGPEQYGVYGTIGALMAIAAAIPDLGMGSIMIREIARTPDRADRYLGASLVLHAVLAGAAYALIQIAAWAAGYDLVIRLWLTFVGVNLIVDALGTLGHERLVAAERMGTTALIAVAHVATMVVVGAAALAAGGRLGAVYGAMVVAGLLRAGVYWRVVRRHGWRPRLPVDGAAARRLITDGLPIGTAALLTLGFMHADKLITTAMIGAAATGQLLAAFVIVFGIGELVGTNMLVAALPAMSRDGANPRVRVSPVVEQLLGLMLLVGVPLAAVAIGLADPVVTTLFGPGYDQAAAVLPTLGWLVLLRLPSGLLSQALTSSNRQVAALVARAAALAVNLVVTITWLPRVGLIGAAAGMVAGEAVMVSATLLVLAPPRDWWSRQAGRLVRLAPPTIVLAWSLTGFSVHLPVGWAAPLGLIAYVGVAYASGAMTRRHLDLLIDAAWRAPAARLARPGRRR